MDSGNDFFLQASHSLFWAPKLAIFWSQPTKVSNFLVQLSIRLVDDESCLIPSLSLQSNPIIQPLLFSEILKLKFQGEISD